MTFKQKLHEIIFEADTPAGKAFDVLLLVAIVLSVLVVMLESVSEIDARFDKEFQVLEYIFTGLFSLEYGLRVWLVKRSDKYIFSFYGIIDLLSILPTYIGLFVGGAGSLMVIRSLRLLRVFRVLKLTRYLGEASQLGKSVIASKRKILVFLFVVLMSAMILGTLMFMIEGPDGGLTSIPRSIYWAIVTLTTVGYGDISPTSAFGQFIAAIIMILGYGIIAVPTGIVTAEFIKQPPVTNTQSCMNCGQAQHFDDAIFCHECGEKL